MLLTIRHWCKIGFFFLIGTTMLAGSDSIPYAPDHLIVKLKNAALDVFDKSGKKIAHFKNARLSNPVTLPAQLPAGLYSIVAHAKGIWHTGNILIVDKK